MNISGGTQSGANLFHSFHQFGLSQGQTANFLSNPSIQNILGRVIGSNASVINGLLQVTGGNSNLFLMNPAGIIFGPHARLNVPASFMATTGNGIQMGDRWFNATGLNDYSRLVGTPNGVAFLGNNPGAILNAGVLRTNSGQSITLLGGTVINTGTITAPGGTITIAAVPGESMVRISQDGNLLSLKVPIQNTEGLNSPTVPSLSLPALLTGGGIPEATGIQVKNGTVSLTASNTPISATPGSLTVSGNLSVNSAGTQGSGGRIGLWGDRTRVMGQLAANAGSEGGNGGLIDTSGWQQLNVTGAQVEARTVNGLPGTWIIDPSDITIATTGGTVTPAQIETSLDQGTNVTLTTEFGTGGVGDITLINPINQTGGGNASLTLTGRRLVNPYTSTISMASTGGLTFNLNQVKPEAYVPTLSIQSAVNAIGSVAGSRTINLGTGTYSGDTLTLDRSLNLNGTGASNTILSGNRAYRVITITPGNTVNLDSVAIANGQVVGVGASDTVTFSSGGGIYMTDSTVTLTNSAVTNNSAIVNRRSGIVYGGSGRGGGIYNDGGTLILINSIVADNQAKSEPITYYGNSGLGGGIYSNKGTLTLTNSTITRNTATASLYGSAAGAGIYSLLGTITLVNSTVSSNVARADHGSGLGAGVYTYLGSLALTNSAVTDNNASSVLGSNGGGINNNYGTLTVTNSVISNNRADGLTSLGGGISNTYGTLTLTNSTLSNNLTAGRLTFGGGISNGGSAVINNSTLANNQATSNSGSKGGGIYNTGSTILTNSTLSSNSANSIIGSGLGGGIYNYNQATILVENSTFSSNSALSFYPFGGNHYPSVGLGGGIYNDGNLSLTGSTLTGNVARGFLESSGGGIYNASFEPQYESVRRLSVRSSLITGNSAARGQEVLNLGLMSSEGYNLLGHNGFAGLEGVALSLTDIVPDVSVDRIITPLGNYGGPTQTHALVPGSPAIDRGDRTLTTPDQRGFPRVRQPDIGAFEFQSDLLPEISLPAFSWVNVSEIIAALNNPTIQPLPFTFQPESTKPLLCVVRSQPGESQSTNEYPGIPDCN